MAKLPDGRFATEYTPTEFASTFVPATLMIIFRNLPIKWWLPAIAIYSIRVGFALDTSTSCVGALQQGQVDAIGADELTLWGLLGQDPNTKIVGRPLVEERYAIGTKKNTSDRYGFLPFLNTWLAGAISDGTWGRLYAQHISPLSKETRTMP